MVALVVCTGIIMRTTLWMASTALRRLFMVILVVLAYINSEVVSFVEPTLFIRDSFGTGVLLFQSRKRQSVLPVM